MKKILGIAGSPRRNGNTHTLVSRVLEGAGAEGAVTELVFLADLTIRECDGCHACWKQRPCPKDDDMNALYPRIAESDALVLGTPVYWYGPTAIMKAFIDRFVYFNCPDNRASVRGKPAVVAIPYEEDCPETGEFVAEFFRRSLSYLEMRVAGVILAPGVSDKGDILKRPDLLDRARRIGEALA